jgi:hypothetical protein
MRPLHLILLSTLLCSLGCASFEPRLGQQILYQEPKVQSARLAILEAPEMPAPRPMTAEVRPLTLLQRVNDPAAVETAVTKLLVRSWSGDRVFLKTTTPGPMGERSSAHVEPDLIVTGTIPYLLVSGGKGTTTVALHLEIHDRRTGDLLWSIDHAGSITAGFDQDFILIQTKPRPPLDPVAKVMDALARDMGEVLRKWNWGEAPPLPAEAPYIEKELTFMEKLGQGKFR